MKRIVSLSCFALIFAIVFSLFNPAVSEAKPNWEFVDLTSHAMYFVDTENIRYDKYDRDIVIYWLSEHLSQDGKRDIIETMKKLQVYNKNWDNVRHVIYLEQVDLATRKVAISMLTYYDDNGNVLESFSYSPKYSPIIPTILDEIFEFLLEQARLGRVK